MSFVVQPFRNDEPAGTSGTPFALKASAPTSSPPVSPRNAVNKKLPRPASASAVVVTTAAANAMLTPRRIPQRPASAHPAASLGIAGRICSPGSQYSTPPVPVLRSFKGWAEVQLVYQIGKWAPLGPLYASSTVRAPPQRTNVSDLRLQPSQRCPTCYSPEFIMMASQSPNHQGSTRHGDNRMPTAGTIQSKRCGQPAGRLHKGRPKRVVNAAAGKVHLPVPRKDVKHWLAEMGQGQPSLLPKASLTRAAVVSGECGPWTPSNALFNQHWRHNM